MDDLIQAGDRVAGRFTYRATTAGRSTAFPLLAGRSRCGRSTSGGFTTASSPNTGTNSLLEVFQQLGVIPALDLAASEATS